MLGALASLFFSFTFVVNHLMSLSGGSWMWSASLRYLFMVPLLGCIVGVRKGWTPLRHEMAKHKRVWLLWSFIGFGLFYAPICFAAAYSPGWLLAGAWQFTIIAGSLLVPIRQIPFKSMGMSLVILAGIVMIEWNQATHVPVKDMVVSVVSIGIATFAYPLGNRKMMQHCAGRLDAYQRALGMTIYTLPLWVFLAVYPLALHGVPSKGQIFQSFIVAVSSGVIATVLFFSATDLARKNFTQLAAVEATQSGEVVFTLLGELLLVSGTKMSAVGLVGLSCIVIGMILHSFLSMKKIQRQST